MAGYFNKLYKAKAARLRNALIHATDQLFPFIYEGHIEKARTIIAGEALHSVFISSPERTLRVITTLLEEERRGAYMRFGDGDVFLLQKKNDSYQEAAQKLSEEMKEAFALGGPGVIKALMIHSSRFGCEPGMFSGNHLVSDEAAASLISSVYPYFVGYEIFSPIALHYVATYQPDTAGLFLQLLKSKAVLFIGNEAVPVSTVKRLFGNAPHVKTPTRNSYDSIDAIERDTVESLDRCGIKFGVVVIAMGCSGRVLMKRLHRYGYNVFMFDFGSLLDGICGNRTRTWLKEAINYDVLLQGL